MSEFELDRRLQQDCLVLGEYLGERLLLMNNALYPWFILVPRTQYRELFELPDEQQQRVWSAALGLSRFLKEELRVDKVNIGAIGNVVSQLHVHVVGRKTNDALWPGVVWGGRERRDYKDEEVSTLISQLFASLGKDFQSLAV